MTQGVTQCRLSICPLLLTAGCCVSLCCQHMPRCTGVECVEALRDMGVTVPVFGVTGNALLSDQARFMAAGATKVFTKPVSKASIALAVQLAKDAKMARLTPASK